MKVSKEADTRARLAAFAGAATAFVLLMSVPAFGHAAYESSEPADDSTISSSPSEVTAEFTEPLSEPSYMDVTDPCGRDVGGETNISADTMTVQMSGEAQGEYVVEYRAHSAIDPHVTTGEFQFTVTNGKPCPGEEEEEAAGSAGGNDNENSGSTSGRGGSVDPAGTGSNEGHKGHSKPQHGKHGRGVRAGGNEGESMLAAGIGLRDEDSEPMSALDGIPLGGLVTTLIMAAVIGAAAGKIYFSLSGEAG